MYHKPMLEILEVEYSVSPGGVDEFEVYSLHEEDVMNPPLFTSTDLLEAVQFCYSLGKDFVVRTLPEWDS